MPGDESKPLRITFFKRDASLLLSCGPEHAEITLQYVERNCFFNALLNLPAMEILAGKDLQLTAGSLGLCSPGPAWFEWGGTKDVPHTTVSQFSKCPVTSLPDVHFWVEDGDGLVYDVLDPYLTAVVAPYHKKQIETEGLVHGVAILGKSKLELESFGLKYLAAEPLVQVILTKQRIKKNPDGVYTL